MHVFRVKVVLSLLLHYFKNNVKKLFFFNFSISNAVMQLQSVHVCTDKRAWSAW